LFNCYRRISSFVGTFIQNSRYVATLLIIFVPNSVNIALQRYSKNADKIKSTAQFATQ
jgi:hypothetical protein